MINNHHQGSYDCSSIYHMVFKPHCDLKPRMILLLFFFPQRIFINYLRISYNVF